MDMEDNHIFHRKTYKFKNLKYVSPQTIGKNAPDAMANPMAGDATSLSNHKIEVKLNGKHEESNKRNRNGLAKGNSFTKQRKNDSETKSNSDQSLNLKNNNHTTNGDISSPLPVKLNGNYKYYYPKHTLNGDHTLDVNPYTYSQRQYDNKKHYRNLQNLYTSVDLSPNNYNQNVDTQYKSTNDTSILTSIDTGCVKFSPKFIIKSFSDLSNVYETSKTLDKNVARWLRNVKRATKLEKPLIESAIKRFKNVVGKAIPDAEIVVFGSYSSSLRLPDGDVDLTIKKVNGAPKDILKSVIKYIKPIAYNRSVTAILNARTPIIRYIDSVTGIKIDVNASPDTSLTSTNVINKWIEHFPPLKLLIQVNKYLIRNFDLNDTAFGGVGSFLLFHMCFAFYLKFGESCKIKNNYSTGFAILCMWKYYGVLHNYKKFGIASNGDFIPISESEQDDVLKLVAYSPVNDGIEFGKRAHQIEKVIALFRHALSACLSITKANVKSSYCDTLEFLFSDSYNKYVNKQVFGVNNYYSN